MAEIIVWIFVSIVVFIMVVGMILLVVAECWYDEMVRKELKKYPTIRIG